MNLPDETDHDRRALPRDLRDREHDVTASTGTFGQRAGDAASRRGRAWGLVLLSLAAALALGWLLLR